jgi:hypothetical protein
MGFAALIGTVIGSAALVLPVSPAGAATQIGQTFTPDFPCSGPAGATFLQSGAPGATYAAPSAGVITSFSFIAGSDPPPIKFKVAHPNGGNSFTMLGESTLKMPTAGTLNTYPLQISVGTGDVIGLYTGGEGDCGRLDSSFAYHVAPGTDVTPGTTMNFSPNMNVQFDVSAVLEPDCDNDGVGDETQDPDISSCNPPPGKATRILTLDANKNKVKKGKNVTLSGQIAQVRQDGVSCAANQTVELQRKKPSQATFTTVEQLQTDAAGSFSAKEKVKKTFEYRVQVPETATCDDGFSNTEKVKVKKPK